MTPALSIRETGVPLYLIPQAITRMVRERGETVYRISVKRTECHHYAVSVRSRSPEPGIPPRQEEPVQETRRRPDEKAGSGCDEGTRCEV